MAESTRAIEVLIDQAFRGDEAARHALLEQNRERLRRMVAARLDRRVASRIDPSDIVQETLAHAARRMDEYFRDRAIPFRSWLRQVAKERVIDAHRRHIIAGRRSINRESRADERPDASAGELVGRLEANDTSPSNRLWREERHERVMAALAALPPRHREVLVMRYLEQRATDEIADALGITPGAVKARLLRALIQIRGHLEPDA
jgi:RNA polymerase sigma-70 factor (ECF subfamily)